MAGFKRISDLPAAEPIEGDELLEVSQVSVSIRITASTISALGSDNSFNDSGAGFIAAGFLGGDRVRVTGFGTSANNLIVGVVTAITTDKLTIGGVDGDVIVDEVDGAAITIAKWSSRRISIDAAVANAAAVQANTLKAGNATHTGDVTGATALTIANDAVTNAKLANMATGRIKGRLTAGTGDPGDLTGAEVTTLLNTFTATEKGLTPAPGTPSGKFLKDDGTWAAPPGGGGGGSVAVDEEGTEVIAAATRFNFIGPNITVTDAGSGVADIEFVAAGGGVGLPYDVLVGFTTAPGSSAIFTTVPVVTAFELPANLIGSLGIVGTNPAASFIFTIRKNGTAVATVTVSTSGGFSLVTSSGVAQAFAAGDFLTAQGPASADASVLNLVLALKGFTL